MRYEVISKHLMQEENAVARFSYFEIHAESDEECEQLGRYVGEHKAAHGDVKNVLTASDIVNDLQRFFSEQLKSDIAEQLSAYQACSLSSICRTQHACTLPFRVESVRYALRIE